MILLWIQPSRTYDSKTHVLRKIWLLLVEYLHDTPQPLQKGKGTQTSSLILSFKVGRNLKKYAQSTRKKTTNALCSSSPIGNLQTFATLASLHGPSKFAMSRLRLRSFSVESFCHDWQLLQYLYSCAYYLWSQLCIYRNGPWQCALLDFTFVLAK